ncbi:MAG TPA: hypothetical protein VM165_04165, partial [Planctomycetaceae bacterium]|nr:hypothetical protein [Planctomycetaceae bacterium]
SNISVPEEPLSCRDQFPDRRTTDFPGKCSTELLEDKAASVRMRAIETIGMRDWKAMLLELRTLRSREQSDKVIQSLSYWIPLLETGYRVERFQEPGRFEVTALTGRGIASRIVEASSPNDPRIRAAVEELRRFA